MGFVGIDVYSLYYGEGNVGNAAHLGFVVVIIIFILLLLYLTFKIYFIIIKGGAGYGAMFYALTRRF